MEGWSSRRCVLTWKLLGTPFNRSYFRLAASAPPTDEIEFGLLLTPTTREEVMDTQKFKERMEKYDNGTTVPNLATQVVGLLPTPTADNASDRTKNYAQGGTPLPMAIRALLPTPTAYDWNTARSPEKWDEFSQALRTSR
jgi:hypothetical protein